MGLVDGDMETLPDILRRYGTEKELQPDAILIHQGSVSDGVYYLERGRLGVYREEQDALFLLSEIAPGKLVGELGAATGWARTATVKAEETSRVIYIPEADFRRALNEVPGLAAEIVRQMGERLTAADVARVTLGRSYQQAIDRAQTLHSEKARLEELLRLREELADTIIHDLRNPLGVISAGLDMLQRSLADGSEPEYAVSVMDLVGRSVRRMQHLVDTLLDIARLEEGKMTLRHRPLDLRGLVEEAILEAQPLAENAGVAVENRLSPHLPLVMADRDVLQRVLTNLLDNALKFTPGGGRVWVEAHPDGEIVRVEMVDTGPGIPLKERTRIFEKFTQVKGRVGTRSGSGLGLAFCQMAVEAHGGRIWVEDGPKGVGSRFVLTLPTAQGDGGG